MKIRFKNRLEAVEWIADYVENEGQFEVLREQLNFNFIYEGVYFLDLGEEIGEVVSLDGQKKAVEPIEYLHHLLIQFLKAKVSFDNTNQAFLTLKLPLLGIAHTAIAHQICNFFHFHLIEEKPHQLLAILT